MKTIAWETASQTALMNYSKEVGSRVSIFPGGSEVKASASNAGNLGSIPGSGRPPEKEMAAHSSIHAWRIPWTEEPGRLQSMGSQRVTQD